MPETGPLTRSMDKQFEKLFAMMEEMKAGQEEMRVAQAGLEQKMEAGQEEMRSGQEEIKNQIQAHVESQVDEIKIHVDGCIGKIEEEVQCVKGKIDKVESEVQEKIGNLERRISELEDRPNNFQTSPELMYARSTIKPLTFDGQTSWTVFKTQFDVVSSTNGWTNFVKASQLVASLRGSAAEVLQGIPADKLTDLTTVEKAFESRFGDSHLTQFYRTELKKRRQKPGESLQVLAADVERLMSLAYAECPMDVRESLAAQYFVDVIRDEDTQHSTRLMDAKDLKSSLAYSMKYEAARSVSKTSRHCCWKEEHSSAKFERDLLEVQQEGARAEGLPGDYFEPGKLTHGCLAGRRLPSLNRAPEGGPRVSSLSGKKNGLYLEGSICGIQCLMLVDTGANVTLLRTDLVQKLKEQLIYTAPNISLKTATGERTEIRGKLDASIECGSRKFHHRIYVADITDPSILGLDFLQKFNFTVDLEKNEIRTGGEEIPLSSASLQHSKSCSVLAKKRTIIPARSECLIQGVPEVPGQFRYAVTDFPSYVSQKGVLVAATLVDLEMEAIPVRVLNLNNKPKILDKGDVIATCEPVVDIVARPQEFSGAQHQPSTLGSLEILNEEQRRAVRKLLKEFQNLFSTCDADVGRCNMTQHRINTGDHPPIKQYPRRLPLARKEEADHLVKEMVDNGIIEESSGPWASPIVLVKKKDGSTRFCVDYRKLNEITKKDSYPLPRIDDTLDALNGSQWFTTLDLKSGYWKVEIRPEDREKTAFITGQGLWQFKVMPFGLCNAPATFEILMETVLRGLSSEACLVYLDDIIIVGRTFEEHLNNLRKVFQRLQNANLKLSPKKCRFFQKEVTYLGHVISAEGLKTDPEKNKTVVDWPRPETVHYLRSFLGLCTYYQECEISFNSLKQALTSSPILTYPRTDKDFILHTDASNEGIGAVLSQNIGNEERVIAYFSKSLGKPERNYCVTRKELLAIVKSIEHFHHYLYGRKFILRTDHASLRWLLNFKEPEGQIARWIQRLQEYDFEIQHRKGTSHGNADALSRRPCAESCKHCTNAEKKFGMEIDISVKVLTTTSADLWSSCEIQKSQLEDPNIKPILEKKLNSADRPSWQEIAPESPATKRYWALWDSLHLKDGVLYRKWESDDGNSCRWQLILPKSKIPEVLRETHDSASGGHFGVMKTLSKTRERFYWDRLRADVEKWCRECHACGARKGPKIRTKGRLQRYNVGAPFERMALDILGPFPVTTKGNRYVVVLMDYFTKWPQAIPIPDQEASTVAEELVRSWISCYGVPMILHSDQGTNFNSALFTELCKLLGILKTRTTALHPESDGMVERFNRKILNHLALFVSRNQTDWDTHLPLFLLAYRSAEHEVTGLTPAEMLFGRTLRLPCDILFGRPSEMPSSPNEYMKNLETRLESVHAFARERIKLASERMKTRYDSRATDHHFKEGDLVWMYNPKRRRGLSPKLQQNWEGPYTVVKKLNDVVYRVQRSANTKPKVIHINRLAPYRATAHSSI
ncbi:Transposon Ty3-I Gag-Pol polyprotein [Araneus ventricosus]|uniref:RNA-directed DNA polymerase n=1 Tax=Araneus ventricosus TaxID=182803 RepID=A0A4Y2BJ20_ARAVE|nr:Transposon Ty3-I Gag-Pol polyprotein [Araneus ventricosus]